MIKKNKIRLSLSLAVFFFSSLIAQGEMRREDSEKKVLRNGVVYILEEDLPYTGIIMDYSEGRKSTITYREGLLNGERVLYYKNGLVRSRESYRDGYKEGPTYLYYDNGQLMSEVNYIRGKKSGERLLYGKNGEIRL